MENFPSPKFRIYDELPELDHCISHFRCASLLVLMPASYWKSILGTTFSRDCLALQTTADCFFLFLFRHSSLKATGGSGVLVGSDGSSAVLK